MGAVQFPPPVLVRVENFFLFLIIRKILLIISTKHSGMINLIARNHLEGPTGGGRGEGRTIAMNNNDILTIPL